MTSLRNIAIIAHVDHGKTTLVDAMLHQSGTFRENQHVEKRVMDSNDLERERGITILAKCTSIDWKDTRINLIDTPGHADFGGEVERVLSMVDGVVLLVDSAEGPMPQTKFVLSKALALGLHPIVVINKVDRPDARIDAVHEEVFDLFIALGATDEQVDFPLVYASAKEGWATTELGATSNSITPLMETIMKHVPAPNVDPHAPFAMLVTMLHSDPYVGRLLTGRVQQGSAKLNMPVHALQNDGTKIEQAKLAKIFSFRGIQRVPVEEVQAGDIISIAGFEDASVADTIADLSVKEALHANPIDPPTMAITVGVNDSPLAGKEGKKLTSQMIRTRLEEEAETNVSITVTPTASNDAFEIGGRGELQLGVLLETMRREGFELSVSRPRVLFHYDEATGQKMEPVEEVIIDVDDEFSGTLIETLSMRKGDLQNMAPSGGGKTRLTFHIPSRGLIGYHGQFLTETRGTGIMHRLFYAYEPYKGNIDGRHQGVLVSMADGESVAYALWNLEERGTLFVGPQQKIYEGMIIGEHQRDNDLDVNPIKGKQLTNMRASGKDDAVKLSPPRKLTLEEAIAYIQDDELVELTPHSIRLRKKYLKPHERKKEKRKEGTG